MPSHTYVISFEALLRWRGRAAQPGCPLPLLSDLALPTASNLCRSCDRLFSRCLFGISTLPRSAIRFEALDGWRGRAAQPGCPLPLPSDLALPTATNFYRSIDRYFSWCLFRIATLPYLAIGLKALDGWCGRAAQPGCPLPLPSDLALPSAKFYRSSTVILLGACCGSLRCLI